MENNVNSSLLPKKKQNLKNRKELRIKLTKLSNSYFKPRCEHFINNMRALNFKILESSGGKKSIEKEVKESRNFRFGKTKDYFIHLTDLSPYKVELAPFISNLKKQFTKEEINIIKKNKEYYIQNDLIRDNIPIFNDQSLYQVLSTEEKEEEIEKANVRVFHDLNFFDKRRNIILNLNDSNSYYNKKSKLPFYQTGLVNHRERTLKQKKNKVNYDMNNLSNYFLKKNKLDIIERDIRKEVKKKRKEDEELKAINEKTKNIVYEMTKKSKSEIKKILDYKDIYNYKYYITNQIELFRKKRNKTNQTLSFPTIKQNNTTSNILDNQLSISNRISRKFVNTYKEVKEPIRKKIGLYKRTYTKEIKKNEENEQMIIRDINRRIKSIYDSFKNKE